MMHMVTYMDAREIIHPCNIYSLPILWILWAKTFFSWRIGKWRILGVGPGVRLVKFPETQFKKVNLQQLRRHPGEHAVTRHVSSGVGVRSKGLKSYKLRYFSSRRGALLGHHSKRKFDVYIWYYNMMQTEGQMLEATQWTKSLQIYRYLIFKGKLT